MKKLIPYVFFIFFLSENANSQIIDYKDDKGNTGFNLNKSVNIPYVKNKISIFIFEKRGSSFDPNSISISEQLNSCNINFDKFVIYRFNLISGTCNKFDSFQYELNGSIWLKKPKSMDIKKHYVCISVPDPSTYNLILEKFGEDAVSAMIQSPKKINYPNPIAFLSFSDLNKNNLESKLLELVSRNDLEEANNKISALNDSLSTINKKLIALKPNFKLALLGCINNVNTQGSSVSESYSHSVGFSLVKNQTFGKRKLSSSVCFKSSALNLKTESPSTETFMGTKQDQFNDPYYLYYKIPNFKETIDFTYLSTGLKMQYFLGEKQQTYVHSSIFYNFGGNTSQNVESFTLTQYGKYPLLNFDTVTISTQEISNGIYQFRESFISGMIGIGKDINLFKDKLMLDASVDYLFSQNLIPSNSVFTEFIDSNESVKFNSTLGRISTFNLNGFSFQLQLNYAL